MEGLLRLLSGLEGRVDLIQQVRDTLDMLKPGLFIRLTLLTGYDVHSEFHDARGVICGAHYPSGDFENGVAVKLATVLLAQMQGVIDGDSVHLLPDLAAYQRDIHSVWADLVALSSSVVL